MGARGVIKRALSRARGLFGGLTDRQYAAAKSDRLTGEWRPINSGINELLKSSRPAILARTRQLIRDFGYLGRAKRVIVNYRVGDGIILQSRVREELPDGQFRLDQTAIQRIEDCWLRWTEDCDAGGRMHYHDIERLWAGEDVEAGESIVALRWDTTNGRYLPLTLQVYEAEWLSDMPATRIQPGAVFDQGVEMDAATLRPIAYHFAVPQGYGGFEPIRDAGARLSRVPADLVLHGFEPIRAGQVRGISPFASAILLADDLQDCVDSTVARFKMASRWLAFIQTESPMDWQRDRARADGQDGRRTVDMQNAILEFLKPGESVNINNADIPGGSFDPFVAFILRTLAVCADVPYELLSGEYGGLNYSTMRVLRSDFNKLRRPGTKRHIRQFSVPCFRAMLYAAHLAGRLDLPGFWENPARYQECIWQEPGQDPLDLLRESRAYVELANNRHWSPQETILARGRNPEDVLDECEEWEAELKRRGLTVIPTSSAAQTNPAAVMETTTTGMASKKLAEDPDYDMEARN